jgi:hypothetical protein
VVEYRHTSNLTENVLVRSGDWWEVIWKGLGVLGGTAALIVLGVVGLARLTVPDEPTFEESLEEAAEAGIEIEDFVPTALGGELQLTGATEDTITLERQVSGPTFGLGNSRSRVFFETDPLTISQMSHEGLAFFPEPEACEFTEGEHNEEMGLVAVHISCNELVDIRDNGTISVEGFAALPSDMVIELDLPDTGGTVTVGDLTFDPVDPILFIGAAFQGSGVQETGLRLANDETDPQSSAYVFFAYDAASDSLRLSEVYYRVGVAAVEPGECTSQTEELVVINPQASVWEITFSCESVDVSSHGSLPVEGQVVFEKVLFEDDH